MTESRDRDSEQPAEAEAGNPASGELDVEGPNESAPGHEPAGAGPEDEAGDRPAGRAPSADGE